MSEPQWRYADIEIAPEGDLPNTARILGEALGMQFELDKSGHYEEFPAFVAVRDGLEYALLGVPDPKYDVRDEAERSSDFGLTVNPVRSNDPGMRNNISSDILAQIRAHGRLRCWLLE